MSRIRTVLITSFAAACLGLVRAASPATVPAPASAVGAAAPAASAPASGDALILDAHDAFVRRDRTRLALDRELALADHHPLAEWVDYWDLSARLTEVDGTEVQAFFARWPGTYLEDRLRNDWLLEAGHRRDWAAFNRDYPLFRMNDDREVTCYAQLADHLAGRDVAAAARRAWFAERDAGEGCQTMAQALLDDHVFGPEVAWDRVRQAATEGRPRVAQAAAKMLGQPVLKEVDAIWENPAHYLAHHREVVSPRSIRLASIALVRLAVADSATAAALMRERYASSFDPELRAWTWAMIARHGAQNLLPDAVDWQANAWKAWRPAGRRDKAAGPDWGDETLAWHARALLRAGDSAALAGQLLRSIDAMSPDTRAQDTWVYWRAKAQLRWSRVPHGPRGAQAAEAARREADAALATLASRLGFYGLVAAEDLGVPFSWPQRPAPLTAAERSQARALPGLQRALQLRALGLLDEGRREWNYTLRGLDDRALLASAEWACERADWQLCIGTSERTQGFVDVAQRYPLPYQSDVVSAAKSAGVDPPFAFGLIRQETRFMAQLRSGVGAAGLMQLMPGTAKWVARKAGIDYQPALIADPPTNLRLGNAYLRLVLDKLGGSQPLAAAAYNAGPARVRRWLGAQTEDPLVWIENIPFHETRDYVKKVLTNAAIYGGLEAGRAPRLMARLGTRIGPDDAAAVTPDLP